MKTDQKDGVSGSLEECQRLLVDKDRQLNEKEGICNAYSIELDALKETKAEVRTPVCLLYYPAYTILGCREYVSRMSHSR